MTAPRPALAPGALVRSDDLLGTVTRVERVPFVGEQLFVQWHVPSLAEAELAMAGTCAR